MISRSPMEKLVDLFFRITSRLFVIFVTLLGKLWQRSKRLDPGRTDGRRMLVVRHGGFGDLLFLSPVLTALKRRYPNMRLDLMTHPRYQGAFRNHPAIGSLVGHRWPSAFRFFSYDYIAFLDGAIETDPEAESENIYDLFARKYFGIELPDAEKKPVLSAESGRQHRLLEQVPLLADSPLRIGLQLKANSPVRTPETDVWLRVVQAALGQAPDASLFIIAERSQAEAAERFRQEVLEKTPCKAAVNTASYTDSIEELIALVSLMDLVLAPDSSICHIAAAFDIPTLGLYGPFPSALRTRYYGRTISLDAPAHCAPCFTHGHWACREARSHQRTNSPCFDNFKDSDLEEAIGRLLGQVRSHNDPSAVHSHYRAAGISGTSETSKFRKDILEAVKTGFGTSLPDLAGVDIGCGGDALLAEAICVDLPLPYTKCGRSPIHLKGNAAHLPWFADNVLDYVYSSHLFEDFPEPENAAILREWLRALKPGGLLILLLPDQPRYLAACARKGEAPNPHHSIPHFGPGYVHQLADRNGACRVEHITEFWKSNPEEYNFLAILRKEASRTADGVAP
jgi:ADP-heptose:LPS heptosyltransferase/SAM-dependent methyltransferase